MFLRVVDTGILSAAENMAWDNALLISQAENSMSEPVLRFLQFSPSCVLVGRHQSPSQEARIEFLKQNKFDINRRLTGGGAIFFDPSQLGWEIYARRSFEWARVTQERLYRTISAGAVRSLKILGVDASFRPRNDIEFKGRKLSGTGAVSENEAFMFQGTLLVKDVADIMLKALRVPAEKLGRHGVESIKERIVFLEELLKPLPSIEQIKQAFIMAFSEVLGLEAVFSNPTSYEYELYERNLPYYKSDKWIYLVNKPSEKSGVILGLTKGKGVLKSAVQVDISKKNITAVQFWGDFFIDPPRTLFDLEAYLKHRPMKIQSLKKLVVDFLSSKKPYLIGLEYSHFADALTEPVSKISLLEQGFSIDDINRMFFVNTDYQNWKDIDFKHFLFPYCSKLVGCKFRHIDDCEMCGKCTVGEGYRVAKEAGLLPWTVTSFEDLIRKQKRLVAEGFEGYIASCCEEFYIKHFDDFRKSGLKIILLKIDSTTCYDLSQEKSAYRGKFESQTEICAPLVRKLMNIWRGK